MDLWIKQYLLLNKLYKVNNEKTLKYIMTVKIKNFGGLS